MLPAIRTHHFEMDHSKGQNNEPPDLGVSPALLLADASCGFARIEYGSRVEIVQFGSKYMQR